MSSSQMSAILIVTITRLFFVVEIFSQNKVRNYVYCVDHVISTGHQMTNFVLNDCFDFFI